jgi:hypothetical protein
MAKGCENQVVRPARKCDACKGKTKKKRRDRIAEFFARPECEEVYLSFLDWWQVMVKDGLAEHDEWPAEFCWDIWHFCRHDMWVADPNNVEGRHPVKAHACLTDALRRRLNESRGWTNGSGPVKLRALFAKDDKDRYKIAEQYSAALKAYRDEERAKAQDEAARKKTRPQARPVAGSADFVDGQWVKVPEGGYGRLHITRAGCALSKLVRYRSSCRKAAHAPEEAWVWMTAGRLKTLKGLEALTPEEETRRDAFLEANEGNVYERLDFDLMARWRRAAEKAEREATQCASTSSG